MLKITKIRQILVYDVTFCLIQGVWATLTSLDIISFFCNRIDWKTPDHIMLYLLIFKDNWEWVFMDICNNSLKTKGKICLALRYLKGNSLFFIVLASITRITTSSRNALHKQNKMGKRTLQLLPSGKRKQHKSRDKCKLLNYNIRSSVLPIAFRVSTLNF